MHRFTALGALLWALLAWTALGAQADLSDEELLQQMDFQRFGGYITGEAPTTSFTVEIVAQRDAITLNDGAPGLRLALTATSEAVAFPRAEVTADAQTLRPINLKLFDESGDLLHDNTFTAYAEVNGVPYFETQLLDNQIVPVNQTLLTITNIQNREIDPATFDPTRLGG